MATRATCYSCRRVFELAPEVDPGTFHCQYCGGAVQISRDTSVRVAAPGAPAAEPQPPGSPASIPVACPHCAGRAAIPTATPAPEVRCESCHKVLTPAYLPLEKWTDVASVAGSGALAESLILILRARWNAGTVAAGEVVRHLKDLQTVVQWLQRPEADRRSDFPLGVAATAEVLKYFVLRVEKAEIQSRSSERVILLVPTRREQPREGDARPKAGAEEAAGSAMILSIGAVPQGSVIGYLARGADGSTGALAADRLREVRQLIAAAIPRATFRWLACRFTFGESMQASSMALVPAAALDKELRKHGLAPDRVKAVVEKASV